MTITLNPAVPNILKTSSFPPVIGLGTLVQSTVYSDLTAPTTTTTFYDSEIAEYAAADSWYEYVAAPVLGAAITNLNPEIATLGENGRLTRVADGIGTIEFSMGSAKTPRSYNCTLRGGAISPVFTGYVTGSVAAHLDEQVRELVDSDPAKTDVAYFSTINHTTSTYTPNPDCWARDIDISCLSVGTFFEGQWWTRRPATLITPVNALVAYHYAPHIGSQVRFRTPAGTIRTVTVIGKSGQVNDQQVITFSAPVEDCNPVMVGAPWMTQPDPSGRFYAGGTVIAFDQYRQVGPSMLGNPVQLQTSIAGGSYNGITNSEIVALEVFHGTEAAAMNPLFTDLLPLAVYVGHQSSGSPCFARVNGELVVLTCWLTAISGPATWRGDGSDLYLNQMILDANADAVASGHAAPDEYTVTVATDPTL